MNERASDIAKPAPISAELEATGKEIIGAAIEVHRHLGPGLLESIYERAFLHELSLRGLAAKAQVPVTIAYKGIQIAGQRLDILVEPGVVVELKSIETLLPIHQRQLVSYLRSTGIRLGYLINFNVTVLKQGLRRLVN